MRIKRQIKRCCLLFHLLKKKKSKGGEGEKEPVNIRAVQAQIAYSHTLSSDSLAASRHTPRIECPLQLHLQSRVSQNSCTVLCGNPPYPFLASRPIRVRCSTRLAFFWVKKQSVQCCCNAWYTLWCLCVAFITELARCRRAQR